MTNVKLLDGLERPTLGCCYINVFEARPHGPDSCLTKTLCTWLSWLEKVGSQPQSHEMRDFHVHSHTHTARAYRVMLLIGWYLSLEMLEDQPCHQVGL